MQNNKKLVFRSDGASLPEIGTGHIIRDIAIADFFVTKNICKQSEVSFISKSDGPFCIGSDLVKESGYTLETIDDKCLDWNTPEEARVLIELDPNLLVIDRLSTESKWMAELKSRIKYVVSMDDVGKGAYLADAVINAILHDMPIGESRYIGYDYLFLKDPNTSTKKEVPEKVNRIVASFGGYDSRNLMKFFLDNLFNHDALIENNVLVELLVGSESRKKIDSWKDQAKRVSIKYDCNINLEVRPANFLERLANADLAILSGGLTIFDAVSLGVPSIALPQYDHQLKTIENLTKKMVVKSGSHGINLDEIYFSKIFNEIISSKELRTLLKKVGPTLIDGKGSERVTKILSFYMH